MAFDWHGSSGLEAATCTHALHGTRPLYSSLYNVGMTATAILNTEPTDAAPSNPFLVGLRCSTFLEDEVMNGICLKGGGCCRANGSCVADLEDRGKNDDDECERGKLHVYDNKGGLIGWRDVLVPFSDRLARYINQRVPLYGRYMAHPIWVPGSCARGMPLSNPSRVASRSPGRRPRAEDLVSHAPRRVDRVRGLSSVTSHPPAGLSV
ncbi:hypothetical protein BC834DRAFT_891780 [Gloeopeniophorella convolvens]|nr:hypothetical protein BC834DRAFT_891780 [Gloeopeniophorella convolvens]